MDIREIDGGGVYWIGLVQERCRWRPDAIAVMVAHRVMLSSIE
jgi:hypothetical protein